MNKLQTKFFLTKKKEKIRYQFNKGKNPLAVVFLHGLMSDLTGTKVKKIRVIKFFISSSPLFSKDIISFFSYCILIW